MEMNFDGEAKKDCRRLGENVMNSQSIAASRGSSQSKNITSQESLAKETTTTKWTNERHSSYLNAIEESFVNQLYNDEQHPVCSSGCNTENRGMLHRKHFNSSSAQFKALSRLSSQKINYERDHRTVLGVEDCQNLSRSPWSHHLRSGHNEKCQYRTHLGLEEKCWQANEAQHLRWKTKAHYGPLEMLEQPLASNSQYLDPSCCTAEGSDQNFADDEHQDELSSTSRGKRVKKGN